jgi:hypothetical protein
MSKCVCECVRVCMCVCEWVSVNERVHVCAFKCTTESE